MGLFGNRQQIQVGMHGVWVLRLKLLGFYVWGLGFILLGFSVRAFSLGSGQLPQALHPELLPKIGPN